MLHLTSLSRLGALTHPFRLKRPVRSVAHLQLVQRSLSYQALTHRQRLLLEENAKRRKFHSSSAFHTPEACHFLNNVNKTYPSVLALLLGLTVDISISTDSNCAEQTLPVGSQCGRLCQWQDTKEGLWNLS